MLRFAYPENQSELDDYLRFLPLRAFRVRPNDLHSISSFPPPTLIPKSYEPREEYLNDAFDFLIDAIEMETASDFSIDVYPGMFFEVYV